MNPLHLLVPPMLLIALTLTVVVLLALKKRKVARQGLLPKGFFKLNTGADMPDELAQLSNNYDNLVASPILFYVLIGFVFVAQIFHPVILVLAWVYVLSRYAHSYVHITSNKVKWRYRTFLWSFTTLGCMWAFVFIHLVQRLIA